MQPEGLLAISFESLQKIFAIGRNRHLGDMPVVGDILDGIFCQRNDPGLLSHLDEGINVRKAPPRSHNDEPEADGAHADLVFLRHFHEHFAASRCPCVFGSARLYGARSPRAPDAGRTDRVRSRRLTAGSELTRLGSNSRCNRLNPRVLPPLPGNAGLDLFPAAYSGCVPVPAEYWSSAQSAEPGAMKNVAEDHGAGRAWKRQRACNRLVQHRTH